jgi:hypothetical protein
MRIAEAAEIVLKDARAPMHVRDIAVAIANRKLFEFRTADTASVVSKALSGNEKFKKVGPGTFAIAPQS